MRRVAVFGNAGGGKSTLARRLAEITGIPLYVIDVLRFPNGGPEIPPEEYSRLHADLLARESWIIDGFENVRYAWERFACADTLIHVDLPLFTHFRWVTKRFVKGLFATPAGWPEGTPLFSSTMSSYRVLWPCHRHLTPKYRALVAGERGRKSVHHLRSAAQMEAFLGSLRSAPDTKAIPAGNATGRSDAIALQPLMRSRITLLTLGVDDLERAVRFYSDGLGWKTDGIVGTEFEHGAVAFFELKGGLRLALWPRKSLAHDAGLPVSAPSSTEFSLGHNVNSKSEVDAAMERAASAGAGIVKQAHATFWGGYAGYFRDPDGHLWEVAWNPQWVIPDE